jgi:DNA end-binding protein Ku
MMAYTLRYAEELRDPAQYFSVIKDTPVDSDQLALAKELIQRKAAKFVPEKFHDEYEAALKELVEAKVNNAPLPKEEPSRGSGKVINLMDALRQSVKSEAKGSGDAPDAKSAKKKLITSKKGPHLVKPDARSKSGRTSKSA